MKMRFAPFKKIPPGCQLWLLAPLLLLAGAPYSLPAAGLDRNGNQLSDIWEMVYEAAAFPPGGDADGDGFTNEQENNAGTDPRSAASHPHLFITSITNGVNRFSWIAAPGKRYQLLSRPDLLSGNWSTDATFIANANSVATNLPGSGTRFFQFHVEDVDSDADGLTDYEERLLGYNPTSSHTDRYDLTDWQRITNGVKAASVISLSTLDPYLSERWSDPGLVVVRRNGGLAPLTVGLTLGGTATLGIDYNTKLTNFLFFPAGVREVWIELFPIADALDQEGNETIVVTLQPGTGYSLGTNLTTTLTLQNETATSLPSVKASARFLIQAGFGPDQDSPSDPDDIPENVEEVMAMGFAGWIDDQLTRPVGLLQPFVEWADTVQDARQLYGDLKEFAWWNRAMGVSKLRPDDVVTVLPDPLRQRLAFALSQILVISDRTEDLAVVPSGMANYYDRLLHHAFGNYRDLLYDVAMHPCMGVYLSHIGNRKADSVARVYPDENFAREIMQLFTIGLWELNPDGTRRLDAQGQPIPTYDNNDITELARVFTGLSYGGASTAFGLWPRDFHVPMKMWDDYHDCGAKKLLGGLQLPARTPSPGSQGAAGLADVSAAVDNLFNHPNVGPFIGRQLIQRFVTSNPGTGYVARVAAAFANNGAGVRGDMKAVIKAVLLDAEARDSAMMDQPSYGKLREPFLRCVNFARAFNASSPAGIYALDTFTMDHTQEPMKAPSVFNFFLPGYSPPGAMTEAGLVAPEFQIINASSAVTAPNYFWNAIRGSLHRWGSSNPTNNVKLNLAPEMALVLPANLAAQDMPNVAPFDPDPLLRHLDLALTGGRLSAPQFQIIRETLERIPRPSWQWHQEYLRVAIYLVVTSPEFSVQR